MVKAVADLLARIPKEDYRRYGRIGIDVRLKGHGMGMGALKRLARTCGVQEAYYDVDSQRRNATPEALLGVLKALGIPIDRIEDAADTLRAHGQAVARTMIEPVHVAGDSRGLEVRLPSSADTQRYAVRLLLEDGSTRRFIGRCGDLPIVGAYDVEGLAGTVRRFDWPSELPHGYHRIEIEIGRERAEALVLCAPKKVFNPFRGKDRRTWGVFLPLYALHSERSWGAGDLTDLEQLTSWTQQQGGRITATLPLLASFWELGHDYSPYAPVSRLFWNEYYLDITRCAGFASCRPVRRKVGSSAFQRELAKLRQGSLVDYDRMVRLKRGVLEQLADHFFDAPNGARADFERFLKDRPQADTYARFRAVCQRHGVPWMQWPRRLRDGMLRKNDGDASAWRYHLYVQWQMDAELKQLAERAAEERVIWYLDLPLGVNRAGFDTWQNQEAFALSVDGGAPPDTFFSKGQKWGFPPMHPEGIRRQHYRYVISMLRHQLAYAKLLRIDHAAGLHRLFWVPQDHQATDGAYVRYRSEELYAILAIESHRAGAGIVAENLGTVPNEVNRALARHGVSSMFILPFEIRTERRPPVRPPRRASLAALNTHDMATFAAFWKGADIDQRERLGLIDARARAGEHRQRAEVRQVLRKYLQKAGFLPADVRTTADALMACLRWLSASDANIVLINLEDLWLETEPQNMPGTVDENPNWRRKAARRLEEFSNDARVRALLDAVHRERKQAVRKRPRGHRR